MTRPERALGFWFLLGFFCSLLSRHMTGVGTGDEAGMRLRHTVPGLFSLRNAGAASAASGTWWGWEGALGAGR